MKRFYFLSIYSILIPDKKRKERIWGVTLIEYRNAMNGGIIGLSLEVKRLPAKGRTTQATTCAAKKKVLLLFLSIAFMWLPVPIYFVGLIRSHMVT